MSRPKKKYYVVWKGRQPGIYERWESCRQQIEGFKGAVYKSFPSRPLAEAAFAGDSGEHVGKKDDSSGTPSRRAAPAGGESDSSDPLSAPIVPSLCVDAACSRNVGPLEYQGVLSETGECVFREGPFEDGTNNVGEFLAIVHGLAVLRQQGSSIPIYSDSQVAIGWVRGGKARTTLARTGRNDKLFELIARAEYWLRKNSWSTPLLKWETRHWGEIPADFGRK